MPCAVRSSRMWFTLLLITCVVSCGVSTSHALQDGSEGEKSVRVPADASVESLFTDFMHYARLGRFRLADAYAEALLAHPELRPVDVLQLAIKDRQAVDTLVTLVANSTIGDNAARVLDIIREGEFERRQDSDRIRENIDRLGGDPQQELFAIKYLADSGEYAIPHMLLALQDPQKERLRRRIVRALPMVGKGAVRPLIQAIQTPNDDLRINVIKSLGELGYEEAIPYLADVQANESMPDLSRRAAAEAIARIQTIVGRAYTGTPAEHFYRLAEQYYNEETVVRADPRLTTANVWFWDSGLQTVVPVQVPTPIFGSVMAMRTNQHAMRLQPGFVDAQALWLASNVRREHRIGLNVESGDVLEQPALVDATQPENYPRALYFTQSSGPRYAHLMLARAMKDSDPAVALGAIGALRLTAGESSLIGTEDYKQPLVQALRFPNPVVRIRAALALGAALPKTQFADSQFVMPVLANAIAQSGRQKIVVIDPDGENLTRLMDALRTSDTDVIGETDFLKAMERARTELEIVSAVFVSTRMEGVNVEDALAQIRKDYRTAQTPVVLLVKGNDRALAEDLAAADRYLDATVAEADDTTLLAALKRVADRNAMPTLDPDLALSMAIEATEVLGLVATDGRTVFDLGVAESSLIAGLASADASLPPRCAHVLAMLPSATAQRSIAYLGLEESTGKELRITALNATARSARAFGSQLETAQIDSLIKIVRDHLDMDIRTAASSVLGALNISGESANAIIRTYDRG